MDKQFDAERYARLLSEIRPGIIESEEEHDRLLTAAEQLMDKGDALAPEERKLLALLVLLVEAYESSLEVEEDEMTSSTPTPHETLQRLMSARQLQVDDIMHFFGNPHLTGEVLSGRRPISNGQARELAKFFQVPAKLFMQSH